MTFRRLLLYAALACVIARPNDVKRWTIIKQWILFFCDWRYSFDCGECDVGDVMLHKFCDILRKYKWYLISEKKDIVPLYSGGSINSEHTV